VRLADARGEQSAQQIKEVRLQLVDFENAWNQGDVAGVLAQYDPSVQVLANGEQWGYGRQVEFIGGLMKQQPSSQRLRLDVNLIRPLGLDHALVSGSAYITSQDGSSQGGPFTAVWMRSGGRWLCIYAHQ
jgi:ketosteroid isomerase-like protein